MSSASSPADSSSLSLTSSGSLSQSSSSISGNQTSTTYRLSSTSFPTVIVSPPKTALAETTSIIKEVQGSGTGNVPEETQNPTTEMSSSSSVASLPTSSSPDVSPTFQPTQRPEPTAGNGEEQPGTSLSVSDAPGNSTIIETDNGTLSSRTINVASSTEVQAAAIESGPPQISESLSSPSPASPTSQGREAPALKTTHEVTTVPATSSFATSTSTIVQTPTIDTTLSSPIVSTSVSDGVGFIVTPEWVTSLSTATAPDGSYLTLTHVAANPTGIASNLAGGHPFFSNTGATAGVFTAVGIVVGVIALGLFMFCRRRRRNTKREQWFKSMTTQPEDPFADSNVSPNVPIMRSISVDRSSAWSVPTNGLSPRNTLVEDNVTPLDPHSGILRNMSSVLQPMVENKTVPVFVQARLPASGRSTPSLYPPSISDYELNQSSEERDHGVQTYVVPEDTNIGTSASPAPPRPVRSLLRSALSRPGDVLYTTSPADSRAPHSPVWGEVRTNKAVTMLDGSDSERESSSVDEISRRPTLLGVRPRPAREIAPSGLQSIV